uniref:Hexosyltransferase n=1 Tax=Pyramimonas obovata TaxID=1411642 RepID=A0A7S0N7C0_9CHLO|mmetsp:Transcript_20915/g.45851  ORF Transcript_20915/g.45851 Transcript_20915/m.45851 type:complete len:377 (+) Transcript_20915:338-1468(+)
MRWITLVWITHLLLHYCVVESSSSSSSSGSTIHVAMTACYDQRLEEALTSIRSTITTAAQSERLFFHIVHNETDGNDAVFQQVLTGWAKQQTFRFALYHAQLPHDYVDKFAPCACQRLFLHNVLPASVDRVIYLDSDTLLLDDIGHLHREFVASSRLAAMGAEHEPKARMGHYRDTARHPYYDQNGVHGLNSGVFLLDLDRVRQMNNDWNEQLDSLRMEYEDRLVFYDQDLLNVYFHQHPEELHLLDSCRWNFRPDHCYFISHCPDHPDRKISLLHGNRGVFHKPEGDKWSVMALLLVYQAFRVPVTGISQATPDLGTCVRAFTILSQATKSWLTTVRPGEVTNNCQSNALPSIVATLHANCKRIQDARVETRPEL